MPLLDLLPSVPPSLSEQLRRQTDKLRSCIIRANYNTQFAQTAPELTNFRCETAGLVDGMDDNILSESFRKTVHLTTYDTYAPLIARFFERPCKASAVVDLLVPGLPDYISQSSSTSGGLAKAFPKYNRLSKTRSLDVSWTIADPLQKRTTAYIWYLGCDWMHVADEENCASSTIYLTSDSSFVKRMDMYLDPEKDPEKMGTIILDHTAPYATGFIKKWRSFLIVHALFAVGSRSLENMFMVFITSFVEMIRHLDSEFDKVVDCIANGTIPDLDGLAEFRHHLERNIVADPERAAELRRIGRPSSQPGWCSHVWPNLRLVTTIASGPFASSVPLARWYLGPRVGIRSPGYGCTECWIGSCYNSLDFNHFKLTNNDIIELLDISKGDSIDAIAQLWEVELGRRYEPILTTCDGLWRYRLGDVVEISGFDPTDGTPIIHFVERRNMAMRFPDVLVSEKELRDAMSLVVLNMPVKVVNWTATIDDRSLPSTVGFFVELAVDQVSDLAHAPERLLDQLSQSNENVGWAITHDHFRKPTLRLVESGTFGEFLQLKVDEGGHGRNYGQVKVPVVLPKPEYAEWFANRVVKEF